MKLNEKLQEVIKDLEYAKHNSADITWDNEVYDAMQEIVIEAADRLKSFSTLNRKYGFCPYCLEEYDIDPNSAKCTNCGAVIPDQIIEMETQLSYTSTALEEIDDKAYETRKLIRNLKGE